MPRTPFYLLVSLGWKATTKLNRPPTAAAPAGRRGTSLLVRSLKNEFFDAPKGASGSWAEEKLTSKEAHLRRLPADEQAMPSSRDRCGPLPGPRPEGCDTTSAHDRSCLLRCVAPFKTQGTRK